MNKKPELLSPAGSFESMVAAINAGCDAVYVGGKQFSARAYASNFDTEELIEAINYCHLRGVKIYITVNTLFKDKEIDKLLEYINIIYGAGVDAIIVQDYGISKLIKETFNDLEIHASTQMTIHNLNGVKYLTELGFKRVVLSRELSLDEIEYITNNIDTEIECFVHGALCYSYSGQCLMSSILGGRSGNRGRCAGTCRLPYSLYEEKNRLNLSNGKYLLSPKDICTIRLLPDLMKAGITSFKIEGRMKSPEYVASVTSIYRKYIDRYLCNKEKYKVDKEDEKKLLEIYNRGGFSEGYYKSRLNMMSMIKPNNQGVYIGEIINVNKKNKTIKIKLNNMVNKGDKLEIWTSNEQFHCVSIKNDSNEKVITLRDYNSNIMVGNSVYRIKNKKAYNEINDNTIKINKKLKVKATIKARINTPISLELTYNDYYVKETGCVIERAKNQSVSIDRIIKQLKKTGEYPFEFDFTYIDIDDDIFIPISEINKIRRNAIEKLTNSILMKYSKKLIEINRHKIIEPNKLTNEANVNILIRNLDQLEVIKYFNVKNVYVESELVELEDIKKMIDLCKKHYTSIFIALPRIFDYDIQKKYLPKLDKIKKLDIDGYLIRTYGEMYLLQDTERKIVIDYNMNIINNETIDAWREKASIITLSPELHYKDISGLETNDTEIMIYGYLPLMVSKQCVVNNSSNNKNLCYNNKKYYLKDRYGKKFFIDRRCTDCINVIYNSSPLILLDQLNKVNNLGISNLRLEFTNENKDYVYKIIKLLYSILYNVNEYDTKDIIGILDIDEFNRGHFLRGIE
ncbi:peptidase U32 [Vallitalea longa]|uniref:Peptidase U32 n=1 Tax=Vallitalea longa TaxID=2936439 RepID=A0A9W6DG31_9FIRM|nr:U32 family peptidase [Vallitalea longa]GKX30048.1 peptidase U32 [Vallitalea longa]